MRTLTVNLNDYGLSERLVREAAVYEGLYLARVSEQHVTYIRYLA